MREGLKRLINNYLLDKQGCKLTELVCEVTSLFFSKKYDKFINPQDNAQLLELLKFVEATGHGNGYFERILNDTISEMIENKEIVAIKYILPNLSYREKMYLFPKGTQAEILDFH